MTEEKKKKQKGKEKRREELYEVGGRRRDSEKHFIPNLFKKSAPTSAYLIKLEF